MPARAAKGKGPMSVRAKHSGMTSDDIRVGVKFGFWEVIDETIYRRNTAENDDPNKTPRYAFARCKCTACGQTEKLVRETYLLNGRSTSCCLRGFAHEPEKTD